MITILAHAGRTPTRLLDYLISPRRTGASVLLSNLGGSTIRDWSRQIESVARLRPRGQKNFVQHIVLAFAPEDRLDEARLQDIARFYLERMGYGEAPFVGFLHCDRAHLHVHIVTTATSFEGRAIDQSFEWRRSMRVAREIERSWGLRLLESPRETGRKAPSRGETRALAHRAEVPARQQFQNDVADTALRSSSLTELVARLREQGYEVRVRLDPDTGALTGLSFAKGGFTFSGAQLGRDFRGNRFLEAFQLTHDPAREAAALARLLEPREPGTENLEVPMAEPLRRPDDPPPREAKRAPSPKRVEPLKLPEGRYSLAAIPRAALRDPTKRLEEVEPRWVRVNLPQEKVGSVANALLQDDRNRAVLVRPSDPERTHLGFRDVPAATVERFEQAGLEPEWKIDVGGGRYDLQLRLSERITQALEEQLRKLVTQEHGLPEPRGIFRDGVRLPGSELDADGGKAKATLVALREEPISAEATWLERAHTELQRGELERVLANRPIRPDLIPEPQVLQVEAAFRLPVDLLDTDAHRLQARIDTARQQLEPSSAEASQLTKEELLAFRAEFAPERGPLSKLDADRVVELEVEIRVRSLEAQRGLYEAHGALQRALDRVDALSEAARKPTSSPEELTAFRQALESLGPFEDRERAAGREAAQWLAIEARHDRERYAAAVVETRSPEAFDLLDLAVRRELQMARLAGEESPLALAPRAGGDDLVGHQVALDEHLKAARSQLAQLPDSDVTQLADTLRESVKAQYLIHRDDAQIEAYVREKDRREGTAPVPERTLENHFALRERQARDATIQAFVDRVAATGEERLPQAVQRVAEGSFTPEALRELNGALIAVHGAAEARLLPKQLEGEPQAWVERLRHLEGLITRDAAELAEFGARAGKAVPGRLLAHGTEAVGIYQYLDGLQRKLAGVAAPGKAPEGVSEAAWRAAWMMRAVEKGLSKELAAALLTNTTRNAAVAVGIATKALGVVALGIRLAVGMGYRYGERVLRH